MRPYCSLFLAASRATQSEIFASGIASDQNFAPHPHSYSYSYSAKRHSYSNNSIRAPYRFWSRNARRWPSPIATAYRAGGKAISRTSTASLCTS